MSETIQAENIPDGFRQTQLGPRTITVPEHWSRVRIKDVSEVVTRGKQPTYVDKPGIPVLNQSCIYWDGYHQKNLKYLDEDVAEDWKPKHFVTKGDIVINSTGQGTLGRALYWDKESGTHAIDSHITRVSVDSETIDPEFLRYYLESTWGQTMLYVFCVAGSTGQIELSKTDLMSMPLLSPPVEEQRRIADILSKVDDQIQQTDKIIEETEMLKEGLMQDLYRFGVENESFSTHRVGPREVEIPTHWELRAVDELKSTNTSKKAIRGGPPGGRIKKSDRSEEGAKLYVQENVIHNDFERRGDYLSAEKFEELQSAEVDPGDVLITRSGTIGKSEVFPNDAQRGILGSSLIRVKVNEDIIRPQYLSQFLADSHVAQSQIKSMSHGGTRTGLNNKIVKSIQVPVPPIEEQDRISEILKTVEERIQQEKKHRDDHKDLKRGLMQDLLTGKVRVNDD